MISGRRARCTDTATDEWFEKDVAASQWACVAADAHHPFIHCLIFGTGGFSWG